MENKGESDHFPEILEILEIPPVERPFRNDPFFRPRAKLSLAVITRERGSHGTPGIEP